MTPVTAHAVALVCVLAVTTGQVLFKLTANALAAAGTPWDARVLGIGLIAGTIYAAATLGWIAVLQTVALSRVYPYMALSFVLVPLADAVIFGEPLTAARLAGGALILAGVVVAVALR